MKYLFSIKYYKIIVCMVICIITPKDDISEHEVVNLVDDSNNVISGTENTELANYINTYFKLLELYYNSQKLKIIQARNSFLYVVCPDCQINMRIQNL